MYNELLYVEQFVDITPGFFKPYGTNRLYEDV